MSKNLDSYHTQIATIFNARAEAHHRATSARSQIDRRKYRKQAKRLDVELLAILAKLPTHRPAHPETIVTPEGATFFLQWERGTTAKYVSAERYNPKKVVRRPETPLQRLQRESHILISSEQENTLQNLFNEVLGLRQKPKAEKAEITALKSLITAWENSQLIAESETLKVA